MKQPRLDAFTTKSVKSLASPLDEMPRIEQPKKEPGQKLDSPTARPLDRSTDRPTDRFKRNTVRRAFEYFQDQLDVLHKFSIDEKMCGEAGNMSQMVREAVDTYIAKRLNQTSQE